MRKIASSLVSIRTPCQQPLVKIGGAKSDFHCDSCQKTVFDLSSRTTLEGAFLLLRKRGKLCVTIKKSADGTLLMRPNLFTRSCRLMYRACSSFPFALPFLGLPPSRVHAQLIENEISFSSQTYGDIRIASTAQAIFTYIEGSLGTLLMLVSAVLAIPCMIVSFKTRRRSWKILACLFLLIAVMTFAARWMIADFFVMEYIDESIDVNATAYTPAISFNNKEGWSR